MGEQQGNQNPAAKADPALQGEGNYSATRRYNERLAEAIDEGEISAGAEAARRALEGSEGEDLRRAEQSAKKGPRISRPSTGTPDHRPRPEGNK